MHATSRLPKCICLCVLFMPRYLNIPTSPLSLNSSTLSISNDKCRLHNWEDFLQTVHAVIINQSAQTCPRITSHYTHLIAIAAKLNSQTAFSDSELPVCVINEHSGHNYSPPQNNDSSVSCSEQVYADLCKRSDWINEQD